MIITCSIVQKTFPECPGCCDSCHGDSIDGDEPSLDVCGDFSVCCRVLWFLDGRDINPYDDCTNPELLATYASESPE